MMEGERKREIWCSYQGFWGDGSLNFFFGC